MTHTYIYTHALTVSCPYEMERAANANKERERKEIQKQESKAAKKMAAAATSSSGGSSGLTKEAAKQFALLQEKVCRSTY